MITSFIVILLTICLCVLLAMWQDERAVKRTLDTMGRPSSQPDVIENGIREATPSVTAYDHAYNLDIGFNDKLLGTRAIVVFSYPDTHQALFIPGKIIRYRIEKDVKQYLMEPDRPAFGEAWVPAKTIQIITV